MVYAISRRTNEHEQNYHSSKLELLAIVWAVGRLRPLLLNIPFKIISVFQALIYLNSSNNAQLTRWRSLLEDYDAEITHRPGTRLAHVDALSPAPVEPPENESVIEQNAGAVYSVLELDDEILLYQCSDPKMKKQCEILYKGPRSNDK